MRPSQNLPLPPRLYPPFQQLYATLPESTPPSLNIPPFSTTICAPPRIYPPPRIYLPFQQLYPPLQESTPPSQNIPPLFNSYMRPSQNLSLPPRIKPLFHNYNIIRPSQNLPLPPRIYSPCQPIYMCDPPRIYLPFPFSRTIRFCDPPKICPLLSEYFSVLWASVRFSHSYMYR